MGSELMEDHMKYTRLNPVVPLNIHIGVTGHRKNINEELISEKTRYILKKLDNYLNCKLCKTPYYFTVISPLAEGADCIVADEVLKWKKSVKKEKNRLDVILPLPEQEYIKDFTTKESRNKFYRLIAHSNSKKTLKNCKSREEAYEYTGHYTVNNCDFLIAIWNGKPAVGKGGTAEIIDYAKRTNKHLFWINSITGKITENVTWDNLGDILKYTDIYNKETLKSSNIKNNLYQNYKSLKNELNDSKIPSSVLDSLYTNLLLNFTRADMLADKYQSFYISSYRILYILAASAALTVSVQHLLYKGIPQISWLQVAVTSAIIILLLMSNVKDFHRRWIDYRFLSETLRSSIFFSIMGKKSKITEPMPYSKPSNYNNWAVKTCTWICDRQLQLGAKTDIPLEKLKNLVLNAWINDQINFYTERSHEHLKKHKIFSLAGTMLFATTFITAVCYSIYVTVFSTLNPLISNLIAIIGIIAPFTAAIIGIDVYREHLRNSRRYQNMVPYLHGIRDEIVKAEDINTLIDLLDKANEVMLAEHQDWQAILSFHDIKPPRI